MECHKKSGDTISQPRAFSFRRKSADKTFYLYRAARSFDFLATEIWTWEKLRLFAVRTPVVKKRPDQKMQRDFSLLENSRWSGCRRVRCGTRGFLRARRNVQHRLFRFLCTVAFRVPCAERNSTGKTGPARAVTFFSREGKSAKRPDTRGLWTSKWRVKRLYTSENYSHLIANG